MHEPSARAAETLSRVRTALLALTGLGIGGMAIELLLLAHYEDATQVIPLVAAGAALVAVTWTLLHPGPLAVRTLQFVMLGFVTAGIVGVTMHAEANAAAHREADPGLEGRALVWRVVTTPQPPVVAPLLMVQLGLFGLLYTYRHPALAHELDMHL
jgi:hypothetical protein